MMFLKQIAGAAALGTALLLSPGPISSPAQAGYIVIFSEIGPNVVASGSGNLDLAGLQQTGFFNFIEALVEPDIGAEFTGPAAPVATPIDSYSGSVSGPSSFGFGSISSANSGSGDMVGIGKLCALCISVPSGYVSGAPLLGTSIYNNQTIASLGLTLGTYEWTWGAGPDQNFTIVIGATAVPEPASAALLGAALAGLLLAGTIRRGRHSA